MEHNSIIPCVVEDGYNTSYMVSLFTALFYNGNNNVNDILDSEPLSPSYIYLQELIKTNYVEPLRKHFSISSSSINEIRNYMLICGWGMTDKYINEHHDICELYIFLATLLKINLIQFEIFNITDGTIDNINNINY